MGWTPNLVWQTRLFMLGPLLTLWTSCQCTPGYGYTLPCRWQAFSCLWTCAQDIPSVSPPNPSPPSLMTNTICILKPIFPWHPSPKHFACPLHAHSTFIYATVTAPIKLYCNSCAYFFLPWDSTSLMKGTISSFLTSHPAAMTTTVPVHSRCSMLYCVLINEMTFFEVKDCLKQGIFEERI